MPIGAFIFQRVTLAGLGAEPGGRALHGGGADGRDGDCRGRCDRTSSRLASIAGWVTHLSVRGSLGSAALVDWAPWLTWRVPSPRAGRCRDVLPRRGDRGPSAEFERAAGCSRDSRRVLFGWMAIAPPTLARRFGDGRLHLTMMDVGQGDAMLVTFPNGRTLLVDAGGVSTGGGFDIGDRVLGPALAPARHREAGLPGHHARRSSITSAAQSALARDFSAGRGLVRHLRVQSRTH